MAWGRYVFPTNLDLADILGDMYFDFENVNVFFFDYKFLDFQVPRFPKSGPGRAGPGLSHLDQKSVDVLL